MLCFCGYPQHSNLQYHHPLNSMKNQYYILIDNFHDFKLRLTGEYTCYLPSHKLTCKF